MRLEESLKTGMIDSEYFGGAFNSEVYHSHIVITKALKQLKKRQYEENKEEIMRRLKEQEETKRSRIEGFLRGANINLHGQKAALPVEAQEMDGAKTEAKTEEAAAPEGETQKAAEGGEVGETKVETKKKKSEKRKFGEDTQDDLDSIYDFEGPSFYINPQFVHFLPNRLSTRLMFKPNFNLWLSNLLATTYAPDDIAVRKPVPYCTQNAQLMHDFLDIAVNMQHPYLLALAEKCCGLFAQPLSLELRQKYKHFKEHILFRNPGSCC